MFTDTHCHLYKEYYNDLDMILKQAESNNVNRYIVAGCNQQSNEEVIKLINNYSNIYGTLGIHPEDVENYNEKRIKQLEKLAIFTAKEVVKSKMEVVLDNMNSYERRIIHNKLTNFKGVTTVSEGQEPNRHIIIKPE